MAPEGEPVDVSTYDFPSQADGKAIPYGVYDVTDNSAWVSVDIDHDTSVFAVATIEKWWEQMGEGKYPNARRILITADGGGSNGHRLWLWKFELARLAATTGLEIIVCHYSPGTSKWNKIEHRLFSRITHNWRGRPLETYQTMRIIQNPSSEPRGLFNTGLITARRVGWATAFPDDIDVVPTPISTPARKDRCDTIVLQA